jgi:hypothetical protein
MICAAVAQGHVRHKVPGHTRFGQQKTQTGTSTFIRTMC